MIKQHLALTEKQARKLWKNNPEVRELLDETFPNTDLSKDPFPKSWEDLKEIEGSWISQHSIADNICSHKTNNKYNKKMFPTKADAEKVLAEAQLRQLAYRINDEESEKEWCDWDDTTQQKYYIYHKNTAGLRAYQQWLCNESHIYFKRKEDAQKSIQHHKKLWHKYFKINQ